MDPIANRGGRIAALDKETEAILNGLAEDAGGEALPVLALDGANRPDVPGYTSDVYPEFDAAALNRLARVAQHQAAKIGELERRLSDGLAPAEES